MLDSDARKGLDALDTEELRKRVLLRFDDWLNNESLPEEVVPLLKYLMRGSIRPIAKQNREQLMFEAEGYDWEQDHEGEWR